LEWASTLLVQEEIFNQVRYGQSVDQRRDNSDRSSIGYGQSVDQGRVMTPRDLQLGMDNLWTKEGTIPRDLQLGYVQSVDQGRDNYYYMLRTEADVDQMDLAAIHDS